MNIVFTIYARLDDWKWAAMTATLLGRIAARPWMRSALRLGGAYPIWTGTGSVGSVVVGIIVFKQEISAAGIVGLACLMIGIFLVSLEAH